MLSNSLKIVPLTILFLMLLVYNCISQGKGSSKYVDTIEVGSTMNAYIKINSTKVLSLDMGGDDNLIFEMDNGVIKMKAIKLNFPPTNFLVICKDTLLQYYVRYAKVPEKNIYSYDLNEIRSRGKNQIMIASNTHKPIDAKKSSFSLDPMIANNKSKKVNSTAEVLPAIINKPIPHTQIVNEIIESKNSTIANSVTSVELSPAENRKAIRERKRLSKVVLTAAVEAVKVVPHTVIKEIEIKPQIVTITSHNAGLIKENTAKKEPVKTVDRPIIKNKVQAVANQSVKKTTSKAEITKVVINKNIERAPLLVKKEVILPVQIALSPKEQQTLSFLNLLKESTNVLAESKIQGIKVKLSKIYQDETNIYFYFAAYNSSPIDYQIDYVNFEVRSKEALFSSSAKQSIYPVFESFDKNAKSIDGLDNTNLLYSIEKFALRDDEVLLFSIFEKSNSSKGRSTEIKITSADFSKIKKLK